MIAEYTKEELERVARMMRTVEEKGWDLESFVEQLEEWATVDTLLSSVTTYEEDENYDEE